MAMNLLSIVNIKGLTMRNPNELKEIKAFVRGLIDGIKDTHKPEEVDFHLEDYWNAWDETLDINIWIDESDPQKYLATLYRVVEGVRDDETFQRLDYL
jgi:hypothetical protein